VTSHAPAGADNLLIKSPMWAGQVPAAHPTDGQVDNRTPGHGAKRLKSHDRGVERPAPTLPANPRPATPTLTGVLRRFRSGTATPRSAIRMEAHRDPVGDESADMLYRWEHGKPSRLHDVLGADAAVFSLGFRTGEAVLPWWLGALRWPRTNIRWQRGRKEAQVALPPRPAR
jgi:hypothetical protein